LLGPRHGAVQVGVRRVVGVGVCKVVLRGLELLRVLAGLELLGGDLELLGGGLHVLGGGCLEGGLGVDDAGLLGGGVDFVGHLLGTVERS
jgi:hypothetical protein